MKFNLSEMAARGRRVRRKVIPFRPIKPPGTFASDLFAASYAPVVKVWQESIPEIMAEYERTLSEMTFDAPGDLAVRVDLIETRAQSIIVAVAIALERWAYRVELWHRRRWVSTVLSATNVSLDTLIGAGDMRMTLEAAIARNTGLIRSVSDESRRRIGDAVFRGLQRRAPAREVARELREAVAMERKRALNIAADQNVKLASALNEERRRQAGVMAWAWVHSDKRNPRPEHEARDGKLYSDDAADHGREYQGRTVRKPPEDRPGELPYCGCTSRAVLILE